MLDPGEIQTGRERMVIQGADDMDDIVRYVDSTYKKRSMHERIGRAKRESLAKEDSHKRGYTRCRLTVRREGTLIGA